MLKSVLVADGNVEFRDGMYMILFSMGYKVECAPNGNEVLIRLQSARPDLLILDEKLESGGGIKALEKIREFDRQMKVVLLTKDEPGSEMEMRVRDLGVSAVLKKDFSTHIMLKKILEILGQTDDKDQKNKYSALGKIFVVDDNLEMRAMLTTFLSKRGFDVEDAVNGIEALSEIKIKKPKVVLLDERMRGMDGLMVLKKIKELDSSIKVVMMTVVVDEDILKGALKLGACDYLNKPFDLEKLEALVLSLLAPQKCEQDK
jgi:two-component system response regulator (stage 0 sporulation protein F)